MSRILNPQHEKTFVVLLIVFFMAGLYSCRNNTLVTVNGLEGNSSEKSAKIIEAGNDFGFDLFQEIRSTGSEENLLVSPFSISLALSMAYNGADRETKAEMEEAMNLTGLTKEQVNYAYKMLMAELNSHDDNVVFEFANSLFHADVFSIKPDFVSVNREIYDALIEGLDFSSPAAVETINNWVKGKTKGKIEKIIQQLEPHDRMVLLNAVYFYGSWSREFDKYGTRNRDFIKKEGTTISLPMMNKMDTLPYFSAADFKAIKIPYGTGKYNMVVLLPHEENNTQDLIDQLSAGNWNTWMNSFKLTERVDVTMPRFKFAYETSLKEVLSALGMEKAFLPKEAHFSGISDEDLFISEIKHKTFIDVNETGTEAAAVTSVGFATTSFREEPPTVPFYVNRPFLFAITEDQTDVVLFLGEVQNPEY